MKFSERILKARIAETIVSEMLKEAGYFVYRYGYEGLLQSLAQDGLPRMKSGDIEADKVRSMPDFLVMDKMGDVSFVEVKYREKREDEELRERLGRAARYWPEAKVLITYPTEPHFLISSFPVFAKMGKLYLLENDKFIQVPQKLIWEYGKLCKKYLIRER